MPSYFKNKVNCNRRQFVRLAGSGVALGMVSPISRVFAANGSLKSPVKAIAFDAFAIFDPRPIFALAERLFPGKGADLSNEWRTRQFEYTWLRVVTQRYDDFWQVTQEALDFAADKTKLRLGSEQRSQLMNAYLELKPWPEVVPVLKSLKESRFRLTFLSNFTTGMLETNIKNAGLAEYFEQVLSTDQAKTYKPDPHAYQLATDALKLERQEILFVAFAGWDAAGAKVFGYPTFWANRQKLPAERLGAVPDATGDSLAHLLEFLG